LLVGCELFQFQFSTPSASKSFLKQPEMTADEVSSIHNASGTDRKNIKEANQDDISPEDRDFDAEEKHSNGESHQLPELQRKLKSRHLQMIAMGQRPKCFFCFFRERLLTNYTQAVP
jgi:hypothetical protein